MSSVIWQGKEGRGKRGEGPRGEMPVPGAPLSSGVGGLSGTSGQGEEGKKQKGGTATRLTSLWLVLAQTSAWKLMVEFVLASKSVDHEMHLLQDERFTPALKEANGVDLYVVGIRPVFIPGPLPDQSFSFRNLRLMPPVCVKQIADNRKFWGLPFSSSTQVTCGSFFCTRLVLLRSRIFQNSGYAGTVRSVGGLLVSRTKTFDISFDPNDCKQNEGAPKNPYE